MSKDKISVGEVSEVALLGTGLLSKGYKCVLRFNVTCCAWLWCMLEPKPVILSATVP